MENWTDWMQMPSPEFCRLIKGPDGPGVYQIRNRATQDFVLFGISVTCRKRMKSFFPKPHGIGTRNNFQKRQFILDNWKILEYRTWETKSKDEAKLIEDKLKAQNNHLFNT